MNKGLFAILAILVFAIGVGASHIVEASQSTKPPSSSLTGSGAKPADLLDANALADKLFPEGQKIEMQCKLAHGKDGRFHLLSTESQKKYKALENSLLEAMIAGHKQNKKQQFKATVRMTVFQGENFVFITKVTRTN